MSASAATSAIAPASIAVAPAPAAAGPRSPVVDVLRAGLAHGPPLGHASEPRDQVRGWILERLALDRLRGRRVELDVGDRQLAREVRLAAEQRAEDAGDLLRPLAQFADPALVALGLGPVQLA